jgi:hypothetical protein
VGFQASVGLQYDTVEPRSSVVYGIPVLIDHVVIVMLEVVQLLH